MSMKRKSSITVESGSEEKRGAHHVRPVYYTSPEFIMPPPDFLTPEFSIPKQSPAKIVVAIDFGTTYSGFAYALSSDIAGVHSFYDWPDQHIAGARPYCKTQTSLLYMLTPGTNNYELKDWGWTAIKNYNMDLQRLSKGSGWNANHTQDLTSCGYLATKFKLQLAPISNLGDATLVVAPLPRGLTAKRLISDYLRCLSEFIMTVLNKCHGGYISKKDVQWCLTVPTLWDDGAKQQMVDCAELAGLVLGPLCREQLASPHSLVIVLEPEAASVYCQRKLREVNFTKGSKFLVVDVGGGTVDLVVHEKVEDHGVKVREIACSTGDLCGGTYIDEAFYRLLLQRISCFEDFSTEHPTTVLTMQEYIEKVKCSFSGESDSFLNSIEIPAKLSKAWKNHDKAIGWWRGDGMYDTLTTSREDIISVFSGVVEKVLCLIGDQITANPKVEAILLVGGFSSSPYLLRRICETYSSTACRIFNPIDPGTAVCRGAVAFGTIDAEVMLSRKSRKTYVIAVSRKYQLEDPPEKKFLTADGEVWCRDAVSIFVKKGDSVPINHSVKRIFSGRTLKQKIPHARVAVYVTDDTRPTYVTDQGMKPVRSWTYPLPLEAWRMNQWPLMEGEMSFRRTMIEVAINPVNYRGPSTLTSVQLETVFI